MNRSLQEGLRAAADVNDYTPRVTGAELLNRGRRRRRQRRAGVALAGVAVAGCLAATSMLIIPADPSTQIVAAAQIRAATIPHADRILAQCARVEDLRDEEMPTEPQLFGPHAAVITADVSPLGTAAFILGSNRRFYAECNLEPRGEAGSFLHEYSVSAPPGGGQNTLWGGRNFTYRDRFPAEVAKVRLDLYGGGSVSAETVEGFVAFKRATHSAGPSRITLYDRSGKILAAADWGELPPEYDSLLPSAGY